MAGGKIQTKGRVVRRVMRRSLKGPLHGGIAHGGDPLRSGARRVLTSEAAKPTPRQERALRLLWKFSSVAYSGTANAVGITKAVKLVTLGRIGPALDTVVRTEARHRRTAVRGRVDHTLSAPSRPIWPDLSAATACAWRRWSKTAGGLSRLVAPTIWSLDLRDESTASRPCRPPAWRRLPCSLCSRRSPTGSRPYLRACAILGDELALTPRRHAPGIPLGSAQARLRHRRGRSLAQSGNRRETCEGRRAGPAMAGVDLRAR